MEARFGRTRLGSRELGVSHFGYGPGFRGPDGMDVIAVGGPKPDGGRRRARFGDWPD